MDHISEVVASALSDARVLVLGAQEHAADVVEPALVARHILQSFDERTD